MLLSLSLIFALSATWFYFDWADYWSESVKISTQEFDIKAGESGSSVIRRLNQLGVISKPIYAKLWLRLFHRDGSFKAGTYQLPGLINKQQLLLDFLAGKVKLYQITVIPGSTYQQTLSKLIDSAYLVNDLSDTSISELLDIEGNPEGWFLPDTYSFPKGYKLSKLLKQGHQAMLQQLTKIWDQRDVGLLLDSPYEMLILASIVEKETALRSEKSQIAGVFTLRLKKRKRLQTDPTVIYGLGNMFDGNLRKKDLQQDTEYNTYTRFGLPPTPIALPDLDSLVAVAHPAETGALYFVADGSGGHDFSKTLEEHNKKVRKLVQQKKL